MVRDPFEIHVSTYFYVHKAWEHQRPGGFRGGRPHPIIENGWSLNDYLEHRSESYLLRFFPEELSSENYRRILDER